MLRAALWYAQSNRRASPSVVENAVLYDWAVEVFLLKNLCLRDHFSQAARKAFAEIEANEDALEIFKMATSKWERDMQQQKLSENLGGRLLFASVRSVAIQCTLSNPAVVKYVDKNKVKILAEMRTVLKSVSPPKASHSSFKHFTAAPFETMYFSAWLEATTLRSRANLSECVVNPLEFLPHIDLKKVRLQDLSSICESEVENIGKREGLLGLDGRVVPLQVNDSFLPSKAENRQIHPFPCSVCEERVSTFMYCRVCKLVVYCGKDCQKRDWKRKPGGHKQRCALLKENVTDVLLKNDEERGEIV
mmetsp:Transcript_16666/g.33868  ORF Transcript_16666/g.33868 Transcript_16666/m.33868 type:complete len:305 (-) Transcript_16666:51-965(-)